MNQICPFCNRNMSEVEDTNYPKLTTFLCYGCGYSIDECIMEDKELFNAYERLFYEFQDILKPKNLGRFKPSTDGKHDKYYRQGNRT